MIKQVFDEEEANYCDKLLTKLIREEPLYDNVIFIDFIVNDYFKNVIKIKTIYYQYMKKTELLKATFI